MKTTDYLSIAFAGIITLLRVGTSLFAVSAFGLAALLSDMHWLLAAVGSTAGYVVSSFIMFLLLKSSSKSKPMKVTAEAGNFPFYE